MQQTIFTILLVLHIIGGGIALFLGSIIMFRKKGDKQHKLMGKFFAYGMLLAAFVSLAMARIHPNDFLFIIGIFTIYLVGTGMRYLRLKQLNKAQKPLFIDWVLFGAMVIFSLLFIYYGIIMLSKSNFFGIVLLTFGLISGLMLRSDYQAYNGKSLNRNFWLIMHLQRMTASYIASLTAFLVVNNVYLPNIIAWLLPTIILTPLIFKWSAKYAK